MDHDRGHVNVAYSVSTQADLDKDPLEATDNGSKVPGRTFKTGDVELDSFQNRSTKHIIVEVNNVDGDYDGGVHDDDDFNLPGNRLTKAIDNLDQSIVASCRQHKTVICRLLCLFFLILYLVYFCYALYLDVWRALALWVITIIFVVFIFYKIVQHHWGDGIYSHICAPPVNHVRKYWRVWRWIVPLILIVLLALFAWWMKVFHILSRSPEQLISGFGLVVFILFSWLCSKTPGRVQWTTVFWGVGLQLALGIFILRSTAGFDTFNFLGQQIQTFLDYTDYGSEFVFSAPLEVHFFIFKVLPVIIFCTYIIGMLDYLGIMGWIIKVCAWVMQYTMEVSGAEALCASANIFVGMTIAPVMVKHYLHDMTSSELHSVVVGGLATIAGSVLGAYINFGISAAHLLSASVISAPAALATAKLFYPETKRPRTLTEHNIVIEKGKASNVLEAMVNAAQDGLKICAAIVAQIIAILATLAFINAVLSWLGSLVNCPQLTFELICRYVLYPVAWLMGVESADCELVAELIGVKTFLNEFVAYQQLAGYISNRSTGIGPTLSLRSEVIATYALCGFSNLGSLGIMLGALGPMIPGRKGELSLLCLRAIVAATVACCMTGCVAGLLYDGGRRLFDSSDIVEDATNATALFLTTTSS